MPHLSPMSWLMAILTFWAVCAAMSATMWWYSNNEFMVELMAHKQSKSNQWHW